LREAANFSSTLKNLHHQVFDVLERIQRKYDGSKARGMTPPLLLIYRPLAWASVAKIVAAGAQKNAVAAIIVL